MPNDFYQFKNCFHVETIDPNQTFLLSEKETLLLKGELYYKLASFLKNGSYTQDKIVDHLSEEFSPEKVYYGIFRLEKAGYLEKDRGITREFSSFCHLLDVCPKQAQENLKNIHTCIVSLGGIDSSSLQRSLEGLGLSFTGREKADLTLVVTDDYLNPELNEINQKMTKPWVLVKPIGSQVLIGPIFKPGETACLECVAYRLKLNRLEESYIKKIKENEEVLPIATATLPSTLEFTYQFAATEIFKWILKGNHPKLDGKIFSYDFLESCFEEHSVTKRPQCTHCGQPNLCGKQLLNPIKLENRAQTDIKDGGNRQVTPESTLSKYSHHISSLSGIVQFLDPVEIEGSSMHVFRSGHNYAVSNIQKGIFPKNLRSQSSGKGKTKAQAKASGLCEAIERYSGIFEGYESQRKGSYCDLKNEAIHLSNLLLYSEKQYQSREESNKSEVLFHLIPQTFSETEVIDWTPVYSLSENKHKLVPSAFCYYNHTNQSFCKGDSNGNAAGNCLEEAILQGFYELVERDAIAIWWYNRLQRPGVDLESFNDPYIQNLTSDYHKLNRNFWVLDITHDLGIPTFVAVSQKKGSPEELLFGFGTQLNPHIALIRALTELNQFLSGINSWKEALVDDPNNKNTGIVVDWLNNAKLEEESYLKPHVDLPFKKLQDYHFTESEDLLDDINKCRKIVEDEGMEMLVLDQTRPDIGLNVVKVIVPGLRHFWPRFAPGRLYDVPVKLGWLKEKKKEEDLNPIGMFI